MDMEEILLELIGIREWVDTFVAEYKSSEEYPKYNDFNEQKEMAVI